MRFLVVAVLLAQAGTPPPDTEVFLAPLSVKGRTVEIGAPANISNNPGYDNQPSFTPDGGAVLFTSQRGERKPDPSNPAAIGSDIYKYDIAAGRVSQVTNTPESEFSPTVTPDGNHISVIRVEADATQRVWMFALDDTKAELVLRDVKPVGYHAWASDKQLALFVLGQQGQPPTLQLADVGSGETRTIATNIGRSIQRIPGGGISFVLRQASEGQTPKLTISELDVAMQRMKPFVELPAGVTDADTAWTPDGLLLVTIQGKLFGGAAATLRFLLSSIWLHSVSDQRRGLP